MEEPLLTDLRRALEAVGVTVKITHPGFIDMDMGPIFMTVDSLREGTPPANLVNIQLFNAKGEELDLLEGMQRTMNAGNATGSYLEWVMCQRAIVEHALAEQRALTDKLQEAVDEQTAADEQRKQEEADVKQSNESAQRVANEAPAEEAPAAPAEEEKIAEEAPPEQ